MVKKSQITLDGDGIVYLAGYAADSRCGPFSHSAYNAKLIINKALKETGCTKYKIKLSNKDSSVNFRTQLYPEYKANRRLKCVNGCKSGISTESYVDKHVTDSGIMKKRYYFCTECASPVDSRKPVYYNKIRQYLVEKYDAIVCGWGEADDWMHTDDSEWIGTHDKDIPQRAGKYFNLKSHKIIEFEDDVGDIFIADTGKTKTLKGYGFKWFCAQMLTGDTIDNIPKPYKGDGPVWIMKVLGPLKTSKECWNMVKVYYNGTNNNDKLWLMAKLLWCARKPKQECSEEVIEEVINGKEENRT